MGPVADVLAVGGRAAALLSGESPGTGWDALPVPLPLVPFTTGWPGEGGRSDSIDEYFETYLGLPTPHLHHFHSPQ